MQCNYEYISDICRLLPEICQEQCFIIAPAPQTWDNFFFDIYNQSVLGIVLKREINESCEPGKLGNIYLLSLLRDVKGG